jgi:hypothetical protein
LDQYLPTRIPSTKKKTPSVADSAIIRPLFTDDELSGDDVLDIVGDGAGGCVCAGAGPELLGGADMIPAMLKSVQTLV